METSPLSTTNPPYNREKGREIVKEALASIGQDSKIFVRRNLELVERIKAVMAKRGMSSGDLAKKLDKTDSEISRWLSGMHNLTFRTLAKVEAAIGEEVIIVVGQKPKEQVFRYRLELEIKTNHSQVFDLTDCFNPNQKVSTRSGMNQFTVSLG
mgnify:CR=1 FL=1